MDRTLKQTPIYVVFLFFTVFSLILPKAEAKMKKDSNVHHLGGVYYADERKIYLIGEHDYLTPFNQADYESFEVLSGASYSKDKGKVYFQKWSVDDPENIDNSVKRADIKTFKSLNDFYAKDKQNAFYATDIIIDADCKTFSAINSFYAKDKNRVYFKGDEVPGANPEMFVVFGNNYIDGLYGKDDKNIYFSGEKIEVVDYGSFRPLAYEYCKDRFHIYCVTQGNKLKVTDFDYNTFEVFESGAYGRDKDSVYTLHSAECDKKALLRIPGIDPSSAEEIFIDAFYSDIFKDKNNIFINGKILFDADVNTFEVLSPDYYRDKNNVYRYNGDVMRGVDPKTFDADSFNYLEWEKNNRK